MNTSATHTTHTAAMTHPMRRSLRAAFIPVFVAAAAAAWGCARSNQQGTFPDNGDSGVGGFGGDGGDGAAPPIQGLTSISLAPTTASLTLQLPVTAPGATTQLEAKGTFQDGHTADVTAAVSWSVSPIGIAGVTAGAFSSPAPGTFGVVAVAGPITSDTATIKVTLTGNVVAPGVTQGDLDGTPSGAAPTIAYPLDGSLFPYQLGPIEFQVVPTTPARRRLASPSRATTSTSRSTRRACPSRPLRFPTHAPSRFRRRSSRCSMARAKARS
jgi:hypothetical protein